MFNKNQIKQIAYLNNKLSELEKKIFILARQCNHEIEEKLQKGLFDIDDYEIDSNICFCIGCDEVVSWNEDMKFALKNFKKQDYWGIADEKDHNTATEHLLRFQKHCWFLHRLYDDFLLSWDKICQIDNIWFEIVIWYQYNFLLKENCLFYDMDTLNKSLFKIEEKIFSLEKQVNIMSKNKVLKEKDKIYDYELEEEISFCFGENRELESLHSNVKFFTLFIKRNKKWRNIHKKSWMLSRLQEKLGGFGLKDEEIMKMTRILASVVARYQYRMCL